MKEFSAHHEKIEQQIVGSRGFMLFLDFDGTISPIVPKPEDSYLPLRNRRALDCISRNHPVAIVTGRSISFIKKRVPLRRIVFGASHGLEWDTGSGAKVARVKTAAIRTLQRVRRQLVRILHIYPGLLIEAKRFSLAFHYHLLPRVHIRSFLARAQRILKPIKKSSSIKIFWDKKTIELVPYGTRTKGSMARFLIAHAENRFKRRFLPIYIGDTSTDEDAFRVLRRGITIRVGKKKGSAARYYFKNRREVDLFLAWLAALARKR